MLSTMVFRLTFFLLFYICTQDVFASYYDTLPSGVKNFTFRLVQTGDISGSYGSSGNFKGYNINASINADSVKGLDPAVDAFLAGLSADQYAQFNFGSFQGQASSKVTAQAFGAGYGVNDNLTFYAYVPFYSATVDLKVERTQKGRNSIGNGAINIENLPDVNLSLLQSLFVNYYHYQPLGKWQANDFGDTEIGFMYHLNNWKNAGSLLSMGLVAPTGRKDNPDILQDISFGDGQWDAFAEFGGGYHVSAAWSLEDWVRITYQFPYTTKIRLPQSSSFPVTRNEGDAKIKLGNKFQENAQVIYSFSDQLSSTLLYTLDYTQASTFDSSNAIADDILSADTEKVSHSARLSLSYSTISLFKLKKFWLPLTLSLSAQSIFAGKNIPKYQLADFEVRFFF